MRAQQSATATVERVLLYLERRLQVAEHYNRRWDSHFYEMAWLLVFECYYGANPRALLQVVPPSVTVRTNPNSEKPWFREKYARPLRRVVRNEDYYVPAHDGQPDTEWFDQVLECGHRIEMQYSAPSAKRPKHRRCPECVEVTREASHGSAGSGANTLQRADVLAKHLPQLRYRRELAAGERVSSSRDSHAGIFAVSRGDDDTETPGGSSGPVGAA